MAMFGFDPFAQSPFSALGGGAPVYYAVVTEALAAADSVFSQGVFGSDVAELATATDSTSTLLFG